MSQFSGSLRQEPSRFYKHLLHASAATSTTMRHVSFDKIEGEVVVRSKFSQPPFLFSALELWLGVGISRRATFWQGPDQHLQCGELGDHQL